MNIPKCSPVVFGMIMLLFITCKKSEIVPPPSPPGPPVLPINNAPIARAGYDVGIVFPSDTVQLNGESSTDDVAIRSYQWKKLSGPAATIVNAAASKTMVRLPAEGIYQFELMVIDNTGISGKDTVQVIVHPDKLLVACDGSVRKQVPVRLVPVAQLLETRDWIVSATANNKILFAGGYEPSHTIQIFNTTNNLWTKHELAEPRAAVVLSVLGNKIFIADGRYNEDASSRIDIYDAQQNSWSAITLPFHPRRGFIEVAAAAGNTVIFLSGSHITAADSISYTFADIYNTSTNTWRTDTLHNRTHRWPDPLMSDMGISATVIGNKIYFAGNASDWYYYDGGTYNSEINIYDVISKTWTQSRMDMARGFHAGIASGNKNYWAGGAIQQPKDPFTNKVEIREAGSTTSTTGCLLQPNAHIMAAEANNQLVFFSRAFKFSPETFSVPRIYDKIDIYDIASNTWLIGVLPVDISEATMSAVNNVIYISGGVINGQRSNKIWKLEY